MKRFVCAAFIGLAGAAHAQVITIGPHWTAESFQGSFPVVGASLIWTSNVFPGRAIEITVNPDTGNGALFGDDISLAFQPSDGYRITGYDVGFDFAFAGDSYVVQGGETGIDFAGMGLLPGDTFYATGFADLSFRPRINFGGPNGVDTAQFVQHFDGGTFPHPSFSMSVNGAKFCPPTSDPNSCSFGFNSVLVYASLSLSPISITPTLVPVPEPSTYALLSIGLALLMSLCRDAGRNMSALS